LNPTPIGDQLRGKTKKISLADLFTKNGTQIPLCFRRRSEKNSESPERQRRLGET
jgi:hypothetical protein